MEGGVEVGFGGSNGGGEAGNGYMGGLLDMWFFDWRWKLKFVVHYY